LSSPFVEAGEARCSERGCNEGLGGIGTRLVFRTK
jgi:hypothetical protein